MAEPTIGDQLGLGPQWQPMSPIAFGWNRVNAPDGTAVYILVLSTPVGIIGIPMSADAVRDLADQGRQITGGLVIPTIPAPPMEGP